MIKKTPNPIESYDENGVAFDKEGKEVPEGYLFGIIPYYENPFAPDGTMKRRLKTLLYVLPFALLLAWTNSHQ
ncbi:MAG: hypothetical protein COB36_14845 [Alphaproteobacteria bacterium]|nr:MAG: hypothetical protein COB36_14845 [Alphaproteobacteria bacterium]